MADHAHSAWQRARVAAVEPAADGITRIVLATETPIRPQPGSHADVRIDAGDTRSYSIVDTAPDGHSIVLGVQLSPTSRGGSRFMHSLRAGDQLDVAAPLQNFPLRVGAPRYVLLAGGVGITAIVAMAETLRRLGADYRLIYVGRSQAVMAFLAELAEAHGDRLEIHVDAEGTGLHVPTVISGIDSTTELYMCGPIRLMDAVRRSWADHGLPPANLRFETFGNSGWFDAEEFDVSIPRLGVETTVGADETLLEALERVGVEVMFDCRKGECGLCQIGIIEADSVVDHREVFFSAEQKAKSDRICACVSRVVADKSRGHTRGSLVLDAP